MSRSDVELVVPGVPNLHGHAFQRAFAGLAEKRESGDDSFWSWREAMYRFAERLDLDGVEAIAALGQMEMLEAGYTHLAEFHYLHRPGSEGRWAEPLAVAERLVAAARTTGIGYTHLPVFYARGGFDKELAAAQERFALGSVDEYLAHLELLKPLVRSLGDRGGLGAAPHSLRAVSIEDFGAIVGAIPGDMPVHVHIAEQQAEVRDCVAATGARPVQLLLDSLPVDRRFCLVHATHVDESECEGMARSGAVAGLCPTTEANLGDGLFPMTRYRELGGAFGVGSDSHVTIDPYEELRLLEYGQRLRDERRGRLAEPGQSVGHALVTGAVRGGAQACATRAEGRVTLDPTHPRLIGHGEETLLDAVVLSNNSTSLVRDVFVGGERVVEDGRHLRRDEIVAAFRETLARLGA